LRVPSFKGLSPASAASSRVKRRNRSRDTAHEKLLRQTLWRMGLRYRKNCGELPGKPDLVFLRARVAVFCDGDFWHGRDWDRRKAKLEGGTNARYWVAKIASNVGRDARNTAALQAAGWLVIRLWETDIKRDPTAAAELVSRALFIERAGAGVSLTELIDEVRNKVAGSPDLLLHVDRVVGVALGDRWRVALEERFDRQLAEASLRFYEPSTIPSVNPNLPASVSEVRFKADLRACATADVSRYRKEGGLFRSALRR